MICLKNLQYIIVTKIFSADSSVIADHHQERRQHLNG